LLNSEEAQSTADRLLHLLKMRGPQQAVDAGGVLGMTAEAARQQLVKLVSAGLVESFSQARGVGRPAQLWQLTGKGHGRFPDGHSGLTVQLLDAVRETFGEQAIDRLISVREEQSRDVYRRELAKAADLPGRVELLAQIRSREGYMADFSVRDDGSFLLVENHCPICAAATTCQGFCRSELQTFEQVLEARVERTEHLLQGARRCAYLITPF
jgi:predicted ArsR family transcriptional regulator